ncbi:peptidase M23, partial [Streptomyces sp. ME19-01-6]|nr:peptidase M23 [Streptomyces sp. ME19-01-6]
MPSTRRKSIARVALGGVVAAFMAIELSLPAAAADRPKDPSEIWPQQVGITYNALPCVAGGPSAQDAATAAALNPQLQNKMRGYMNAYNTSCARAVVQAVKNRGLNERAAAIAIATTIVETSIANLDGGDATSVGLYQQQNSWGSFAERTNPTWATNKFLAVMESFYPNGSWNTAPIGDVAADVQRPAAQYRYRYAEQANDAVVIAHRIWSEISRHGSSVSGDGKADIVTVLDNGDVKAWRNGAGFAQM